MQRLNVQIKNLLNISSPNVDFDAILMENKYLKQRLEDVLSEKKTWTKTVSKYKSMLSNNCQTTGKILSYDQIAKHINTMTSSRSSTQPDVTNLKQICITLLDTLNEKNLLLQHQRKTNKILANRILELEKQTRGQDTCEVLLRGYSASGVSSETAEWDSKDREENETTTLNKLSKDDDEPSKHRPSEDTIKGIEQVDKKAENESMKCDNSTSQAAIEKEKVMLERKIYDSSRTPEGGMNCTGLECLRRNKTDNLSDAKELSENARDPIDGLGIRKPLDNDIKQVGNHNHVNKHEDFHEQTNNRKRVQGPAESQVIKDGKSTDRELSFEEHEDIQSLPIELQKLVLQAMKDLEKDELKSV
ncbi:coiled-coil domain-containing protein 149 isoform X2 [Diaphorina citri]|uniref:Coiled-coil domain-containing protein 149 isoform X2 n=1 Tax=Diaphorina citri TaxID=121845 RepID=A0A3Q0J2C8_DIACI|nr:coiled-coil domain-containing protein 149 isoform X2 [Diaphorina citri]